MAVGILIGAGGFWFALCLTDSIEEWFRRD